MNLLDSTQPPQPVRLKTYFWVLLGVWTMMVAASLAWNLVYQKRELLEVALITAKINYEKDLLYRKWCQEHGGVYVPVTPESPGNPYLAKVSERDIRTPSGRLLTLINPANMTRQVYESAQKHSLVQGHLTSLKPLRPENAPDPWESQTLKSFQDGKKEAFGLEERGGLTSLRLMRPFIAEKSCLKCHAQQGYQAGDILGGLSVSVPLAPFWSSGRRTKLSLWLGHGLLWLLGVVGLTLASRHLGEALTEREQAETALQQANDKLIGMVYEYSQRNREVSSVNEMMDQLQSCLTVEEAYQVIAKFIRKFFPDQSGGLFMINASKNFLEAVASWGESPPEQQVFAPQDCWALRRGRLYQVTDFDHGILCSHVPESTSVPYLCVPIMAQGEALGILHLQESFPLEDIASGEESGALPEATSQLAATVAEHLGLALANLKLQETLRQQAIRDPLTGLFNRRFMEETLEREIHRVQRKGAPLGIIMMDLDHFKSFNDTFGHGAGDMLLSELGNILVGHTRKEDVACRYGGEEFTLIMSEASLEVTLRRAEEVRQLVEHLHLQHQGQSLRNVTVSLGVAVYPEHGNNAASLLGVADAALYRAKKEGRNRVVVAQAAEPHRPEKEPQMEPPPVMKVANPG